MGIEPGTLVWWVLLLVLSGIDITLWALGCVSSVGAVGKFRFFACAGLLSYFVLALIFGCGLALGIWALAFWILAIVGSALGLRVMVD